MKKILSVLLLITFINCNNKPTKPTPYIPVETVTLSQNETELFVLINEYRKDNNLSILKHEALTTSLALEHNDYMIEKGIISHDFFSDRAEKSHGVRVGEVCAYNYQTSASILSAYIHSPNHKKVLDNPIFTHVGVSIKGKYNTCLFTSY